MIALDRLTGQRQNGRVDLVAVKTKSPVMASFQPPVGWKLMPMIWSSLAVLRSTAGGGLAGAPTVNGDLLSTISHG